MIHTLALLVVLTIAVGCETQADRDRVRNAELEYQTALQESRNDMTKRVQAEELRFVNMTQGELAGLQLEECFDHGYDLPRIINVDGQPRPVTLSNRKIANCDRIMKIMQRHQADMDAEEKREDAAYEKAHPQKK